MQPVHVAGYIEELGRMRKAPTVKQNLICIRMLFDWLMTGQVIAVMVYAFARVSAVVGH